MSQYTSPLMLIAGNWIAGSDRPVPIVCPATESVIGELPVASGAQLDQALASAQRGFEHWSRLSAQHRAEIVLAGCRLLRERADRIALSICLEQGKPVAEGRQEVLRAAAIIEWDMNEGLRAYGTIVPGDDGFLRYGLRLPIGPVAAFTPWNFPISSPARKIGAALAAGCSIIIKSAEETPAATALLVQSLLDGGLPPEVVNIVNGTPAAISQHLLASPIIRAATFTGSTAVGKHLAALAAQAMKPMILELGGHSPVLVFDDVEVERVATMAVAAKFRNAGQICTAPTRFIVQRDVYARFTDAFATHAAKLRVGDGLEAETQMGPMANARRIDAMQALTEDAVARGARVATGGKRLARDGYFFAPTVLADVPLDADVMNIEPFGPMAPVVAFDTVDEAISLANALPYGLYAYAFTQRPTITHALTLRVESGSLSLNHFGTALPDSPFGGVKDSGYGREGGYSSLDGFMVTKFISHKMAP